MTRRRFILLLVSLALFAGGCSDATPSAGTRAVTATVTPTATAAPAVAATSPAASPRPDTTTTPPPLPAAMAQLVPAALPLASESESPDPFAGWTPHPSRWQVYHVRDGRAPALLYESARFLAAPAWLADSSGVTLSASSQAENINQPTVVPHRSEVWFGGQVQLDPQGRRPPQELVLRDLRAAKWSPDGRLLAIQLYDRHRRATEVYLVDGRGDVRQVSGIGSQVTLLGWTPDGTHLLVGAHVRSAAPDAATLYLVPLTGAAVAPLVAGAVQSTSVRWSPDGTQLAYVAERDLFVYDRASGQARRLTAGGRYTGFQFPAWSADGRRVVVAGDLIDAASGQLVASLFAPDEVIEAALSPDGHRLVATQSPWGESANLCNAALGSGQPRPALRLTNRTAVSELATGTQRVLRDCGEGFFAYVRWLRDSRHLALLTTNCWQCGGTVARITLLDLDGGGSTILSEGGGWRPEAYPSPTDGRVLVSGATLRMYAADGRILQEWTPSPGSDVTAAAWAPDGSGFVYVVGPSGFSLN